MTFAHHPLIVYIHVPKTGGSTVNQALENWAEGCAHVEKYADNPSHLLASCANYRWISGHVPFYQMQTILEPLEREVRYFATVRDPLAQIRSHINWFFEIHRISKEFFRGHPEKIRSISKEIRENSLECPEELIDSLVKFHWFFFNFQSRFFFSQNFNWSRPLIHDALSQFDYVATEQNVSSMICHMDPEIRIPERKNVSTYHFDKTLFEADIVRQFVRSQNVFDRQLYAAVKRQFVCARDG